MPKPTKEGDLLAAGPLLRFVPNWKDIYWEYDKDRPSPRAWRKRPGEDYTSIYLEGDDPDCCTSVDALKKLKPNFAIIRVTAETLISLGNVRIEYKRLEGEPEGHAHFGIFGINRSRAERLVREPLLTERAKDPGPPEQPPSQTDVIDEPRDPWQGRS